MERPSRSSSLRRGHRLTQSMKGDSRFPALPGDDVPPHGPVDEHEAPWGGRVGAPSAPWGLCKRSGRGAEGPDHIVGPVGRWARLDSRLLSNRAATTFVQRRARSSSPR